MKKFNFSVTFFLYSLLVYIFYIIIFIFIKKKGYENGIYYFTPAYVFVFIKLLTSDIKKLASVMFFTVIPFSISVYLSIKGMSPGWEVSGMIPVMVLLSFLFKSSDKGSTPLKIVYLNKIILTYLGVVLLFCVIHFIKTGSIDSALYLAVSIYSPAPVAVTTAIFVNFIISTAAVSAVLNNLDFFNNGAKISRLLFDTDRFLNFPHFNLSGIETLKDVSQKEFIELVEKLNQEASVTPEYSEILKKEKIFSKTFEDGTSLAMAPLSILIEANYSSNGIAQPQKNDDRSFIGLAKDNRIIGFYAIDSIKPSTNAAYLEVFEKSYGVKSVIVAPENPEIWEKCCETVKSFSEIEFKAGDMAVTDDFNAERSVIQAAWGGNDFSKGDIFIAKPFLSTLHNFIILSGGIKNRLIKGVIFCSFPFAFSLFSISFGLMIPQISAVSVLFSFVFTMIYVFYVKPPSNRRRMKK